MIPGTSAYGLAFEHFVLLEIFRLERYARLDFRFSYLRTKNDVEIDLVIERPGRPLAFVEIKSSVLVADETIENMARLIADFPDAIEGIILSQVPTQRVVRGIRIYPWRDGIDFLTRPFHTTR